MLLWQGRGMAWLVGSLVISCLGWLARTVTCWCWLAANGVEGWRPLFVWWVDQWVRGWLIMCCWVVVHCRDKRRRAGHVVCTICAGMV